LTSALAGKASIVGFGGGNPDGACGDPAGGPAGRPVIGFVAGRAGLAMSAGRRRPRRADPTLRRAIGAVLVGVVLFGGWVPRGSTFGATGSAERLPLADALHRPTSAATSASGPLPFPNWRNLSIGPTGAPPSYAGGLAYDAAAGETIWVGGGAGSPSVAETWSYRAGAWTDLTPALSVSPPASAEPALAYDATERGVVLVLAAPAEPTEETWLFAGGSWTNLTAPNGTAPPARQAASLAYDPACGCDLLFGGGELGGWVNDTWTYSNGTWATASTGPAPSPRQWAGLAYAAGDGLVLVGGEGAGGLLDDTWTWAAGGWTRVATASTPAGVAAGPDALAPDPDGSLVAFGGLGCSADTLDLCNNTYEYSAGAWRSVPSADPPSPREGLEIAYDAADGYVLGYGGGAPWWSSNETWALGGPMAATVTLDPQYSQSPNSTTITTRASGGYGVYHYDYSWPDSEEGTDCPSVDLPTWVCIFDLEDTGNRTVRVVVNDSVGNSTSAETVLHLVEVFYDGLVLAASTVDVGENISIHVVTPPAYPGVNFTWYGLPLSCYPATTANVSCVATLPGFYALSCLVVDALGARELTTTYALWVYPDPVAVSWPDRTNGPAPLGVGFHALVSSGTPPYALTWSFGDGASNDTLDPSHTYESPGNYSVALTVRDATGWSVTTMEAQEIVVGDPLNATVDGPGSIGAAPTSVALRANATGGVPPYAYDWLLPDGATATGANVTVPAPDAGTYTVKLTVSDASGVAIHASTTFTVPPPSGAVLGPLGGIGTLGYVLIVGAAIAGLVGGWALRRARPHPDGRDPRGLPGRSRAPTARPFPGR